MLSLFTIKPTEKNVALARAAQIYYKRGAYAEHKPEQKSEDKKPVVEQKTDQKPKVESKAEQKPVVEQKPKVEQKADQKKPDKPVEQKPVAEKKPEDKKSAEHKPEQKSEDKKPVVEQKTDQKPKVEQKPVDKSAEKPVTEPVVEILDRDGNIVAMLPGVPEEAPKAARTTGAGFDINNFVKPKQSKQQDAKNLGQVKSIDKVYSFIRTNAVLRPFDPMPGFSLNEKVTVLKKYANFNGTHPGLDVLQINTLIMVFNSPDLSRKMINCGLDPKQVLGIKRFNEVPANKYDSNNAYDFAFEYTLSKKKKLVLLVNSIPTYDEKQGWMSGYNISVR